jgi:hypothetical protein
MAAPTKPAYVKKALANLEPSTHGTFRTFRDVRFRAAHGGKADVPEIGQSDANDPSRHLSKSSKFFAGGSLKLSAGGSGAPSVSSSARESAEA